MFDNFSRKKLPRTLTQRSDRDVDELERMPVYVSLIAQSVRISNQRSFGHPKDEDY